MYDLKEFCAPGVNFSDQMIDVSGNISLRLITFTPPVNNNNPAVLFVPGWVSIMESWQKVLLEMTKDFKVYYLETREKKSSKVRGRIEYSVHAIAQDIVDTASLLKLENYILFGSSLGATAILESSQLLKKPRALVLVAPNAEFRVPRTWIFIVKTFSPYLYLAIKPAVKWYLKNFRLDVKSDQAQYNKYSNALDIADPWKLKKAVLALSKYRAWDILSEIEHPVLLFGASKDVLHEPGNLEKMAGMMKNVTFIDMETNTGTHSKEMVEEVRKYLLKIQL